MKVYGLVLCVLMCGRLKRIFETLQVKKEIERIFKRRWASLKDELDIWAEHYLEWQSSYKNRFMVYGLWFMVKVLFRA